MTDVQAVWRGLAALARLLLRLWKEWRPRRGDFLGAT
jgi:hypothetical protein